MITIEKADIYGWESAIRGMRNPMNSWDKTDSLACHGDDCEMVLNGHEPALECNNGAFEYCVGQNDIGLMKRLINAGTDHSKFMRFITVTFDINAPLYWWKEFDTYKVGTVANSCSTMHKIHDRAFTLNDFSNEHLKNCEGFNDTETGEEVAFFRSCLISIVEHLNIARQLYLDTGDKDYWWQMIQLLPTSYNQKRTVQLNYQVLQNIYHSRKNHKLDEWLDFCKWIKTLPYSELITKEETEV